MMTALSAEELVKLQLFRGESPVALEWLPEMTTTICLHEGDTLISPDQVNDSLYILLDGRLRVELELEGRPTISHISPGECVGELSVLDEKPTAAYVIADRDCCLLVVARAVIWHLILTSHAVARNLLFLLATRVRHDNTTLSHSLLLQRKFERRARIDALTALYNRLWLEQMLPRQVERTHEESGSMSLMMLDVDHFKAYNDTHGHLAGDQALRSLGRVILNHIRPVDSAVRYGGEELVVVMPGVLLEDAMEAAERLRASVAEEPISSMEGEALPPISISIGVTTLQKGQSHHDLLDIADKALYCAKAGGRNCVVSRL